MPQHVSDETLVRLLVLVKVMDEMRKHGAQAVYFGALHGTHRDGTDKTLAQEVATLASMTDHLWERVDA